MIRARFDYSTESFGSYGFDAKDEKEASFLFLQVKNGEISPEDLPGYSLREADSGLEVSGLRYADLPIGSKEEYIKIDENVDDEGEVPQHD